jgi:hypothetical protein
MFRPILQVIYCGEFAAFWGNFMHFWGILRRKFLGDFLTKIWRFWGIFLVLVGNPVLYVFVL